VDATAGETFHRKTDRNAKVLRQKKSAHKKKGDIDAKAKKMNHRLERGEKDAWKTRKVTCLRRPGTSSRAK